METALGIVERLPPSTQPVLVFRDAGIDTICDAVAATGGRWVQLHGSEPIELAAALRARLPELRLIRAWTVADARAGRALADYLQQTADAAGRWDVVLLDVPKDAPHPGYDLLGEVSRICAGRGGEIWCAGGLTPDNLAAAVRAGVYDGVDVVRGIESRPGRHDPDAVRRFIETAKSL